MARPKSQKRKVQINLTIDERILEDIKSVAIEEGFSSLSSLTELLYKIRLENKYRAFISREDRLKELQFKMEAGLKELEDLQEESEHQE